MKAEKRRQDVRVSASVLDFDPSLIYRLSEQTAETLSELPDGGRRIIRAMRAAWVTELTACQRKYLLMYYQDRDTMADIAELCGVGVGTVSRTLSRARNRLRRILQYYL